MSKLILVCGLPATGKTTISDILSKKLGVFCIHKDSIKETLYDALKLSTLDDSKNIGLPSMKLLYKLAEENIENRVDLIIEAPFYFPEDYKIFDGWEKKYGVDIFSVICSANTQDKNDRFRKRERHKAHHDEERSYTEKDLNSYDILPGKHIKVDTSELGVNEAIEKILEKLGESYYKSCKHRPL